MFKDRTCFVIDFTLIFAEVCLPIDAKEIIFYRDTINIDPFRPWEIKGVLWLFQDECMQRERRSSSIMVGWSAVKGGLGIWLVAALIGAQKLSVILSESCAYPLIFQRINPFILVTSHNAKKKNPTKVRL